MLRRRFATIVVDPPWDYGSRAIPKTVKQDGTIAIGVGIADHYPSMTLPELKALPVEEQAAPDAHLYLWTTNAFMAEAHELAGSWGFRQKTILTWTKTHHGDGARVSMKTGHYFRGATEHCLFCVRGRLKLTTSEGLPTGYLWPRLPHSVKPDAFYDLVEKASPGPYLELFARRARLGDWHYWGNQSLDTAEVA